MKKKGYIILLSVFILGILLGISRFFIEKYLDNKLEKNVIEKYGFEISYPKRYKDISVSGDNMSNVLDNITTTVSGEQISEYMQSLNFAETVRELKNEINGIRLLIEAINVEKTSLTLEEICKRYVVMFKIYNEEQKVESTDSKIILLDGNEAGKVEIKVKGKEEDSILLAYLLPLEDKEITITFIAPASTISKCEKEINRIINSLKIY